MIDTTVRAIYHLMLNDKIFITGSSRPGGPIEKFIWTFDGKVYDEISATCTRFTPTLEIVNNLVTNLLNKYG
ncbi:hypothetical protein LCGC14_1728750 [marine sediment metagenome]|uniref:Uncharacterized protein n=1 Tax=marine sediment metagenome TaxID=412755 RepID=A0A0F9HY00_9ZZZZ